MDKSKLRLFHTTREVEMHFDSFLDTVSQGGIAFRSAIGAYLDSAMPIRFAQVGLGSPDFDRRRPLRRGRTN